MTDFHDQSGHVVACTADGVHISLVSGVPVAYIHEGVIFSYPGRHIGWYDSGWIRDLAGQCLLFTTNATGGPAKPAHQVPPFRQPEGRRPAKGLRQVTGVRPVRAFTWSRISVEEFFG